MGCNGFSAKTVTTQKARHTNPLMENIIGDIIVNDRKYRKELVS
ncbi:MAG: hypothetical protein ACOX8P_12500 [Tepidanaerobacteraceae bacterium]